VEVDSGVESVLLPCRTTVYLPEDTTLEWRERGTDGIGAKHATICRGYSPRSGCPGFDYWTRQHLPNVSPSLYPFPVYLLSKNTKLKATSAEKYIFRVEGWIQHEGPCV
ncbi:hypothetical protein ATANTOWER_030544, partial [Ataeniobius toweri]|nr:hypothetical protein [Ataeniobius toweri]